MIRPAPRKSTNTALRIVNAECQTDPPNAMQYASAAIPTKKLWMTTNAGSSLAH